MQMRCKWKCKRGKSFSSFSYELGEKQEQREQREEDHEVGLVELGQGECHGLPVHRFLLRGATPGSAVQGGRPACGWPQFSSHFLVMFNGYYMVQQCMSECRGRPVQA